MPMRNRLSENINLTIGFLSGIIFSNGIGALLQGQIVMAVLSFLAAFTAVLLKRFADWGTEVE